MNRSLVWYRRLLWSTAIAHFGLAAVIFGSPDVLGMVFGLERIELSYVWLGSFAMLLCSLALGCLVIASAPARYAAMAWLAALEKLMASAFWVFLIVDPQYGLSFLPFLILDAFIGVASVVLLSCGLPPEGRLTRANIRRALARLSLPAPNTSLRGFRRTVGVGLILDAGFILAAWFAPSLLARLFGAQYVVFSTVWLRSVAVVLLGAGLLQLPALADPAGRPAVSWLAVASRAVASLFWAWVVARPDRRVFLPLLLENLILTVISSDLLQRGLPLRARVGVANIRDLGSRVGAALVLRGRPVPLRVTAVAALLLVAASGYVAWYHLAR
jgi:hypothetical protein